MPPAPRAAETAGEEGAPAVAIPPREYRADGLFVSGDLTPAPSLERREARRRRSVARLLLQATVGCGKGVGMRRIIVVSAAALCLAVAAGQGQAADKLKACFMYVGPHNDGGYSERHDVARQEVEKALGDKVGLSRFGDATVPLDEALVQAVVDVSGRPYCVHTGEPDGQAFVLIGGGGGGVPYAGSLTRHVFETLAFHAHLALHVRVLGGRDPHHIVEAQFKAFARAFRDAVALDPRETGVPSTKGAL